MHLHLLTTLALLSLTHATPAETIVSTITMAAPQSTSPSYVNNKTFEDDTLRAHNFYRGEHNATGLRWNKTLAINATEWSEGCVWEHSGMPSLGENLASGYANATAAVEAWALERQDYNFQKPGFDEDTGHFTQLVWRNTTDVGCGRTLCAGENGVAGWFLVCEYYPQGNVVGEDGDDVFFRDNVLKQVKGQESDTLASGVTSAGSGVREGRWGPGVLVFAVGVGMVIAL